jgi:hypothetical protein
MRHSMCALRTPQATPATPNHHSPRIAPANTAIPRISATEPSNPKNKKPCVRGSIRRSPPFTRYPALRDPLPTRRPDALTDALVWVVSIY